jgi:hypothetical protein
MAFIKRDLSVQFSTQFFKGISHEMIIDQLKETIDLDQVKSVQLTENKIPPAHGLGDHLTIPKH